MQPRCANREQAVLFLVAGHETSSRDLLPRSGEAH
jgi:hypothetical protein